MRLSLCFYLLFRSLLYKDKKDFEIEANKNISRFNCWKYGSTGKFQSKQNNGLSLVLYYSFWSANSTQNTHKIPLFRFTSIQYLYYIDASYSTQSCLMVVPSDNGSYLSKATVPQDTGFSNKVNVNKSYWVFPMGLSIKSKVINTARKIMPSDRF